MGVADAEALVDFRIDPDFGALPWAKASVKRDVECLAAVARARQAVGPFKVERMAG